MTAYNPNLLKAITGKDTNGAQDMFSYPKLIHMHLGCDFLDVPLFPAFHANTLRPCCRDWSDMTFEKGVGGDYSNKRRSPQQCFKKYPIHAVKRECMMQEKKTHPKQSALSRAWTSRETARSAERTGAFMLKPCSLLRLRQSHYEFNGNGLGGFLAFRGRCLQGIGLEGIYERNCRIRDAGVKKRFTSVCPALRLKKLADFTNTPEKTCGKNITEEISSQLIYASKRNWMTGYYQFKQRTATCNLLRFPIIRLLAMNYDKGGRFALSACSTTTMEGQDAEALTAIL